MVYLNGSKILFGAPMTVIEGDDGGYNKGYKDGQISVLEDSKYMKGKVQATNAISINDCSYIEQDLDIGISPVNLTNNLLTAPYVNDIYGGNYNGVTLTQINNSIILSGTATNDTNVPLNMPALEAGKTYYIGLIYESGTPEQFPIDCAFMILNSTNNYSPSHEMIYGDVELGAVVLRLQPNIDYTGCEVIPVLDTKYVGIGTGGDIDLSTVSINKYGRNLFKWETPQRANTTTYYIDTYLHKGTYNFNSNFHKIKNADIQYGVFLGEGTSIDYQAAKVIIRNFAGTSFKDSFTIGTSGNYRLFFRITGSTTIDQLGEYLTADDKTAQFAFGSTVLPIEPYIEPIKIQCQANGTVKGIKSLHPSVTLISDTDNVIIRCNYYRDIDAYIDNLIMGVALTGGE